MERKVVEYVPTEQDFIQTKQIIISYSISRITWVIVWLIFLLLSMFNILTSNNVNSWNLSGTLLSAFLVLIEFMIMNKEMQLNPSKLKYSEGKIIYKWSERKGKLPFSEKKYYANIQLKDGHIEERTSISDELFESEVELVIIAKNENIQYVFNKKMEV